MTDIICKIPLFRNIRKKKVEIQEDTMKSFKNIKTGDIVYCINHNYDMCKEIVVEVLDTNPIQCTIMNKDRKTYTISISDTTSIRVDYNDISIFSDRRLARKYTMMNLKILGDQSLTLHEDSFSRSVEHRAVFFQNKLHNMRDNTTFYDITEGDKVFCRNVNDINDNLKEYKVTSRGEANNIETGTMSYYIELEDTIEDYKINIFFPSKKSMLCNFYEYGNNIFYLDYYMKY